MVVGALALILSSDIFLISMCIAIPYSACLQCVRCSVSVALSVEL